MSYVPSSPLKTRAQYFLRRVRDAATRESLASGIREALAGIRALVDSVGWPLFKPRPLYPDELPYGDDVATMTDEAAHDLTAVADALPDLAQHSVNLMNYSAVQASALIESANSLQDELSTLLGTIRSRAFGRYIGIGALPKHDARRGETFTETFATDAHIALADSSVTYLSDGEMVTLKRTAQQNLSASGAVAAQVLDPISFDVIGLPGNTLEVETPQAGSVAADDSPEVHFLGESGPHANPGDMLDDSPDTWFEFERCDLADGGGMQRVVKLGDSWFSCSTGKLQNIYKLFKPDRWRARIVPIGQDDATGGLVLSGGARLVSHIGTPAGRSLTLSTTQLFSEAHRISFVEIDPFLPPPAPQLGPYLVRVALITASGDVDLPLGDLTRKRLTGKVLIPVPYALKVKGLRIIFRQPSAYKALIGHHYVLAIVDEKTTKKRIIFKSTSHRTLRLRVESPTVAFGLAMYSEHDLQVLGAAAGLGLLAVPGVVVGVGAMIAGAAGAVGMLSGVAAAIAATPLLPVAIVLAILGAVIGKLWYTKKERTVKEVLQNTDVLNGERWQIGLRSALARQVQHEAEGLFASAPITFAQPVTAVRLTAQDLVTKDLTIRYEVSGDGQTWLPADGRGGIIGLPQPADSVRVRASFARIDHDPDDVSLTPLFYGYTLQGFYA